MKLIASCKIKFVVIIKIRRIDGLNLVNIESSLVNARSSTMESKLFTSEPQDKHLFSLLEIKALHLLQSLVS